MSAPAHVSTRADSAAAGETAAGAPLAGVERLLVVMPSWVGDVTMATPLLRALREALPRAAIATLTKPGLSPLLAGAPWIDERFEAPMRGLRGPWSGVGRARAFAADAVLLLPNSLRSGLAALPLARRRIGYATQLRTWTLTHALAPPERRAPTPAVDYYAALGAFALGSPVADRRIELFVSEEDRLGADRVLDRLGRFLLVNPGANRIDKRWPIDRFAASAASIADAHRLDVAVTGSRGERRLAAVVAEETARRAGSERRVVDLAARGIGLGSLKGVLRRAVLLLTNDTGPRHLAAALGTPSIVLFGPTDHRWTTLPADPARRDRLLIAEPFLPEPLKADDFDDVCLIDRISIGDVLEAADSILGGG